MPEVVSATVRVDGVAIGYLRTGSGSPLVCVHGLIGSASNWDLNLPALATVRTVYALDDINMGGSSRTRALDPTLAATADRLARTLAALGVERADLVGSSHGGAVCMMLAARYPERVRSLILFAPANPFCDLGRGLIRMYASPLGSLAARAIPYLPRLVHDIAHRRVYGDPRKVPPGALEGYTRSLNPDSIHHTLGIVRAWWPDMEDLREALPLIARTPTLLLWGARDGVVGLDSGRKLGSALGATLTVIPGAGHLPFAEEPELSNGHMLGWLGS